MLELTLQGIDESLMRILRQRAAAHGRSPKAEARAILAVALATAESDPWAEVNAIRELPTASGRTFGDSTELIAEDRLR